MINEKSPNANRVLDQLIVARGISLDEIILEDYFKDDKNAKFYKDSHKLSQYEKSFSVISNSQAFLSSLEIIV